jgi:hypothetical protein
LDFAIRAGDKGKGEAEGFLGLLCIGPVPIRDAHQLRLKCSGLPNAALQLAELPETRLSTMAEVKNEDQFLPLEVLWLHKAIGQINQGKGWCRHAGRLDLAGLKCRTADKSQHE